MVGAILDSAGRVLVTKRPDHVHQGGLWEFPGGKLEAGESPEQGLARELAEELGIGVLDSRPLIRIRHNYGDRSVLLDVRAVDAYTGIPAGLEGQPLAWQRPEQMDPACFPAADRPIISALRLPACMLITGSDPRETGVFLARLARAIEDGIRLVQLRAHDLDQAHYRALAREAYVLCEQSGVRLLLNRDPRETRDVPRHGLHLSSPVLRRLEDRPGEAHEFVGASCHDADDLRAAERLGLDYALLSPVQATTSHPDVRPLGWTRFAALVDAATLPVYALGGLTASDLAVARSCGAQGVAAIRGFWPRD